MANTRTRDDARTVATLRLLHEKLDACVACPNMIRPVVHGPAIASRVYAIGQAPGPHEGKFGRPFAWTAGKTLFGWFEKAFGIDEATYRARVYLAAVARCFPGKEKGGADRKPSPLEIQTCQPFIAGEIVALQPDLVVPIGLVAIEQVIGRKVQLKEVVGEVLRVKFHGREVDVICLPHPSGASTWHRVEPGITLLRTALGVLGDHPAWRSTFPEFFKASQGTPRVWHGRADRE